jgi:hypothetical protein
MTSQDGSGILKMQVEWKSPEWKKEGRMVPYIIEESTIKFPPGSEMYAGLISKSASWHRLKICGSGALKMKRDTVVSQ